MLLNENTLKNLIRSVVKSQYSKKLNESLGRSRRFLNEEESFQLKTNSSPKSPFDKNFSSGKLSLGDFNKHASKGLDTPDGRGSYYPEDETADSYEEVDTINQLQNDFLFRFFDNAGNPIYVSQEDIYKINHEIEDIAVIPEDKWEELTETEKIEYNLKLITDTITAILSVTEDELGSSEYEIAQRDVKNLIPRIKKAANDLTFAKNNEARKKVLDNLNNELKPFISNLMSDTSELSNFKKNMPEKPYFVLPNLQGGYYDLANILIKDSKALDDKIKKQYGKQFGFQSHNFRNFVLDYMLFLGQSDVKKLLQGEAFLNAEDQDQFKDIVESLFENCNKLMQNKNYLGRALDEFFSDALLKKGEGVYLTEFANFIKVKTVKDVLEKINKKEKITKDINSLIKDEAIAVLNAKYTDTLSRKGSLTKHLKNKKVGGGEPLPGRLKMNQAKSMFSPS